MSLLFTLQRTRVMTPARAPGLQALDTFYIMNVQLDLMRGWFTPALYSDPSTFGNKAYSLTRVIPTMANS
ncbi:MAG: hypothetical protein MJA83_18070, partial [Gammaproteobacteria bacterium]|nr:hypothetical protein [Gammaproteobacteria bacterium]